MTVPPSPFPPGTTETVVWLGPDGQVLPNQQGAVRGEIEVRYPDGKLEHTAFTVGPGR